MQNVVQLSVFEQLIFHRPSHLSKFDVRLLRHFGFPNRMLIQREAKFDTADTPMPIGAVPPFEFGVDSVGLVIDLGPKLAGSLFAT